MGYWDDDRDVLSEAYDKVDKVESLLATLIRFNERNGITLPDDQRLRTWWVQYQKQEDEKRERIMYERTHKAGRRYEEYKTLCAQACIVPVSKETFVENMLNNEPLW